MGLFKAHSHFISSNFYVVRTSTWGFWKGRNLSHHNFEWKMWFYSPTSDEASLYYPCISETSHSVLQHRLWVLWACWNPQGLGFAFHNGGWFARRIHDIWLVHLPSGMPIHCISLFPNVWVNPTPASGRKHTSTTLLQHLHRKHCLSCPAAKKFGKLKWNHWDPGTGLKEKSAMLKTCYVLVLRNNIWAFACSWPEHEIAYCIDGKKAAWLERASLQQVGRKRDRSVLRQLRCSHAHSSKKLEVE